MAIVKLQNGNVLLKDGKVSCSCCAAPGCCMYPAQALVDGAYTYEDLPDAINVAGVVFTKLNPPESVAGFTRYYVNANDEYLGILDGEEESLWSYEGGGGACLINGYNGQGGEREDQFADSYLVTWEAFSTGETYSTIVYRSVDYICRWQAYFDIGYYYADINLEYQQTEVEGYDWQYKWVLSVSGTDFLINAKPDPQNTPAGSYQLEGPGGSLLPATVS